MTQNIISSHIPARRVVSAGSRYVNSPVIYYGDRRFVTFELYLRKSFKPTGDEKVTVIPSGFEYRPDLMSYRHYGFPDNWWKIMEANGIYDILDFKAGRTIILPEVV